MAEAPPIDDPSTLIDLIENLLEACENPFRFGLCILGCKVKRGVSGGNPSAIEEEKEEEVEDKESIQETNEEADKDDQSDSPLDNLSDSAKDLGSCIGICLKHC